MTLSVPSSRGLWGYVCGAAAGALSAALLIFTLSTAHSTADLFSDVATTPFFMLAAFPLFMVGLGAGMGPCILAGLMAVTAVAVMLPVSFAAFAFLADILPVTGLVVLTLYHRGVSTKPPNLEGKILTALVIYAAMVFLGVYGTVSLGGGDLIALSKAALSESNEQAVHYLSQMGQVPPPEVVVRLNQFIDVFARYVPAFIMCSWLILSIAALAAAQGLLQRKQWNLCSGFSLIQLQVPTWVIFAAAITGIVAMFAPAPFSYIGLNLALIMGVPFFFVGLAVVHASAAKTRWPTLVLVVFYLILCSIVQLALLVALLGAVDPWIDFRKLLREKTST